MEFFKISSKEGMSNAGTSLDAKRNNFKRKRVYWRMTRVLLMISVSFLVLNFPVFFLQVCQFNRGMLLGIKDQSNTKSEINNTSIIHFKDGLALTFHKSLVIELFERFAYYAYYLHFTINFIIFDRLSIFKKSTC